MSIQTAVTEYLTLEAKAHAGTGEVDVRDIAQEVAKRHQITERELWDAVLDQTAAGPC